MSSISNESYPEIPEIRIKNLLAFIGVITIVILFCVGFINTLLILLFVAGAFFLGMTGSLLMSGIVRDEAREAHPDNVKSLTGEEWISYYNDKSLSKDVKSRGKLDMRITGSAIIDEIVHEMIDYVLRDYVHSWYDYVSDNDEFIYELRAAIQESLVNLSARVKEIDWIPYLTTQLVDDSASHLRLYKSALHKVKENSHLDLLSVFFDLEASMEKTLCRDMACTDDSHLNDYMQGLTDSLLYLLLPVEAYACSPIGTLAQDLLVNYVLLPLLNLSSDPDFVNQCIIWICQSQGFSVSSDIFLSVIRTIDNTEEISAVKEYFSEQLSETKSCLEKSQNGDEQSILKSQMKSCNVIKKCIDNRMSILKEGGGVTHDWTDDSEGWQNYFLTPGVKLHTLSLDDILKNSVAVSYFLDYMNGVGGTNLLLLYFNLTAWKSLAEQQFNNLDQQSLTKKEQSETRSTMLECLKTAAKNVYVDFIPENAKHRVRFPDNVLKRFHIQMQTSSTSPSLFDDIYESLLEMMDSNEKYYQGFLKSKLYIKCLMDLDLLRPDSSVNTSDDEDDDFNSLEETDFNYQNHSSYSEKGRGVVEDYQICMDCLKLRKQQDDELSAEDVLLWERGYLERKYQLKAEIIEAGLTTEKGKQYGVYAIQILRTENFDGRERRWHIYRRYSDFYDFHQWIKSKWMRLNKIELPSKHTFRSTDRQFLEKRMEGLNKYLESIISITAEECFGESLKDALLHFFEPGNYTVKRKQFSDKIETFVNPLKQSVKSMTSAVKSAPDTFINTIDGFTKIFLPKPENDHMAETIKVGASIDTEMDDNIPLRIALLLMDEIFDLKQRNQWLRRRIVSFCREILKAMYGDTMNRRIIDNVAFLTNPVMVSGYLRTLQRTLWPDGQKISARSPRSTERKLLTKVAAKASLFAVISDELKRLIGSETTRRGLLCVFEMFQNRFLNKRLVLVLFEGILKTLFPDKPVMDIVQRLHYRSNRVGKQRPFLVASPLKASSTSASAALSPRGTRRKSHNQLRV